MIEGTNNTQTQEFNERPRYIGVASLNIVCVNPNNESLRKLGWNIRQDADEPSYKIEKTQPDGSTKMLTKVRFMCRIQEFNDKPVVPIDFIIGQDVRVNTDRTKCEIIDQYGRTAWGTKDEILKKTIPTYSTGQKANIDQNYKYCHVGEDKLIAFLMKYLGCAPFEKYNRITGKYERVQNPGKLTIDNWKMLCDGDTSEITSYVASRPDNCVKVILGIQHTEDNKTYQTYINDTFLNNNIPFDRTTGKYTFAQKVIDSVVQSGYNQMCQYSACLVQPYVIQPTDTKQLRTSNAAQEMEDADEYPFNNNGPFDDMPADDLPE